MAFGKIGQTLSALEIFDLVRTDLEKVEREIGLESVASVEAINYINQYLQSGGGKRLRPMLVLLSGRMLGDANPMLIRMAAVVEMIHTATLVHDDVLDGASVRRHVPTVNADWGVHNSVLLGDYLFTHAFHLASTLDDVRACRLIGKATNRVCEGELCQGLERGNLDLTELAYFDMIDGKTAELLACACQLGALFSGASAEIVQALTRFGRNVGLAFQIADDLLDLVGDEQTTGKSLGTDLEQQKMTLPLIRALQHGPNGLAERVRQVLLAPDNHKREALRPCLAESDGIDYARRKAEELAGRARKELTCLPPSACRVILEAVTERVVHRSH
jgi:octaprenyl-diphosphate synthase